MGIAQAETAVLCWKLQRNDDRIESTLLVGRNPAQGDASFGRLLLASLLAGYTHEVTILSKGLEPSFHLDNAFDVEKNRVEIHGLSSTNIYYPVT